MVSIKHLLIGAAVILPAWSGASAQDAGDYRVRVGLGAQLRPKFPGADKDDVWPLWDIDVARGTNVFNFEAPDDSFGIEAVRSNGFSLGPVANFVSARKNSDVGVPLGKVKATIEVGGFAQYQLSDSLRLRTEIRQGLNGHKGLVSQIGLDQIWRDGDRYVFSIGPRLLLASSKYQRAYFGVSPSASLATGLPVYDPDGGVLSAALASGLSYQFSPRFGMFGFARGERLLGDAGKSPVVKDLGSRNQYSGGIGLSYTFTVHR